MAFDLTQRPFENHPNFRKKPERGCCAQRRKLLKQVKIMREALEQILTNKDDEYVADGWAAANRMQEQAKAALKLADEETK